MKPEDVIALEKQAKDEYDEKMRAIRIVRTMMERGDSFPLAKPKATDLESANGNGDGLTASILHLMEAQDRSWSVADLVAALPKNASTARNRAHSVGTAVARLARQQGTIRITSRGSGRRPHEYKAEIWAQHPTGIKA